MNYEQILQNREKAFKHLSKLPIGTILYYECPNGCLKLFPITESTFDEGSYLLWSKGLNFDPNEVFIADSDIIKEYVNQREKALLKQISDLKIYYKDYLEM